MNLIFHEKDFARISEALTAAGLGLLTQGNGDYLVYTKRARSETQDHRRTIEPPKDYAVRPQAE